MRSLGLGIFRSWYGVGLGLIVVQTVKGTIKKGWVDGRPSEFQKGLGRLANGVDRHNEVVEGLLLLGVNPMMQELRPLIKGVHHGIENGVLLRVAVREKGIGPLLLVDSFDFA